MGTTKSKPLSPSLLLRTGRVVVHRHMATVAATLLTMLFLVPQILDVTVSIKWIPQGEVGVDLGVLYIAWPTEAVETQDSAQTRVLSVSKAQIVYRSAQNPGTFDFTLRPVIDNIFLPTNTRKLEFTLWIWWLPLCLWAAYLNGRRRGQYLASRAACRHCRYSLARVPSLADEPGSCICPECGHKNPSVNPPVYRPPARSQPVINTGPVTKLIRVREVEIRPDASTQDIQRELDNKQG